MSGVTVIINAGDLTRTGKDTPLSGHQLKIEGVNGSLHIKPETARQWIAELTPIAGETA